jgi:protein-tyrosine-phosphatase
VLFVCLGNICRSPLGEAVLADLVARRRDAARWTIDSAGTGGWHVGKPPDPRTLAVCRRYGIASSHRARQVEAADFLRFDRILAMDGENLANLRALRPADATAALGLLGEVDPERAGDVPDPYYGGDDGFEAVYRQVLRCCVALAASVPDA